MGPVFSDLANDVTNTEITINWNSLIGVNTGGSSVDIDNYELEWDSGNGGSWITLTTVAGSQNSFTKTGLSGGVSYGFKIRAMNEYGSAAIFSTSTYVLTAEAP